MDGVAKKPTCPRKGAIKLAEPNLDAYLIEKEKPMDACDQGINCWLVAGAKRAAGRTSIVATTNRVFLEFATISSTTS